MIDCRTVRASVILVYFMLIQGVSLHDSMFFFKIKAGGVSINSYSSVTDWKFCMGWPIVISIVSIGFGLLSICIYEVTFLLLKGRGVPIPVFPSQNQIRKLAQLPIQGTDLLPAHKK